MKNLRRMWAVALKELRQMRRDRISVVMIVAIPVVDLLLFGYAINYNPRNLHAAVADQAMTSTSRAAVMDMAATGIIDIRRVADTPQELMDMLRRGQAGVGIVIPPDYERRLADGRPAVQVMVDGTDTVVQAAANQLAQLPLELPGGQRAAPRAPQIEVVSFYNPERRSAVSIVPGLIGLILTMTMMMFTAMAAVRERERGNMELLIATPLSRSALMIGKVLPYAAIGLIQTTLILVLGFEFFDVPLRGTLLDVYLASMLLVFANLSMGLLISTHTRTQFQAIQVAMLVFLPSILISGFMFPFAGMPEVVQWGAELLPMTQFLRLIRGIMLRGASLWELWPAVLALVVFTTVTMALAIARFRKRLD
ncbi:ABC transporter permease [Luteimonas sp. MC1572]|uniref:ABC transporter permease n=1 Tax=Luteimonas sp. MC1572 TaxID=2799325 RepID=UPI0018F07ECB|nr:ABC transporter permease [Luteimonas sp. MC1572]MBJ6982602.1 ABC transporter permease [Luteimonas sp. MC1572]QQO03849.1 ABC transporter permease [Luteimonas sp. MC1572]